MFEVDCKHANIMLYFKINHHCELWYQNTLGQFVCTHTDKGVTERGMREESGGQLPSELLCHVIHYKMGYRRN